MNLADALAAISKDWHIFVAWIETLIHHHNAGTLPPAPQPGQSAIIVGVATSAKPPDSNSGNHTQFPPGFASAPNEHGYVQLTQVEADRAQYARCGDADYEIWAADLPHWYAIDDTLTAFALTATQEQKLRTDLAQAETLLALQGAGDWFANRAANLPDSAAFSRGGQDPENHGVHLRNIADALAHQRAHAKAIGAGTNPTGAGAVAGPGGQHGPHGPHGPGHGAMANDR